MNLDHRATLLIIALTLSGGAGRADPSPPGALSSDDQQTVTRAIGYLEGLSTAKGRFVQTTARGAKSEGVFYLQRPGKARFDYDPPSGLAIASDGRNVSVVDRRLKSMHVYPLSATPLGLFLAKDIRLDRGVTITAVEHDSDGFTLVAKDSHKAAHGRISLDFSDSPLSLRGWSLTDARGGTVSIHLLDLARSAPHEADFFKLSDPRRANVEPDRATE